MTAASLKNEFVQFVFKGRRWAAKVIDDLGGGFANIRVFFPEGTHYGVPRFRTNVEHSQMPREGCFRLVL